MADEFPDASGDAVVMRQYGPPGVLRLERAALPSLAADEIRVRMLAAAINHSDLEIRAGTWPILRPDPFPYIMVTTRSPTRTRDTALPISTTSPARKSSTARACAAPWRPSAAGCAAARWHRRHAR